MRTSLSVLMLALTWSGLAAAEGGCPPGQYPYETPQARQCVPIPGGSTSASQSSAVYEDRWGAIAVDGSVSAGGIGTSTNMPSKRKAEKAAIAQCRATGGGNGCEVDLSYYNQCAVIASGDRYMQSFSGAAIESTSQRALEACNRKTTNCTIYYSGCSYPQRVQ